MLLAACKNNPDLASTLLKLGIDTKMALEAWCARQCFEGAEQPRRGNPRPAVRGRQGSSEGSSSAGRCNRLRELHSRRTAAICERRTLCWIIGRDVERS